MRHDWTISRPMVDAPLSPAELTSLQAAGLGELGTRLVEKLTIEMAQLMRMRFGTKSEQLSQTKSMLQILTVLAICSCAVRPAGAGLLTPAQGQAGYPVQAPCCA